MEGLSRCCWPGSMAKVAWLSFRLPSLFPMGDLLPSLFLSYCIQDALSPWPLVWLDVTCFAPFTSCFPGLSTGLLFIHIKNNADHNSDKVFPLSFTPLV